MKKISALLLICLLLFGCSETKTESRQALFNLNDVAGKSASEVEKVLGTASKMEPVKDRRSGCKACPKLSYKDGAVEVVYINDLADWITVNVQKVTADDRSPEILGLPAKQPTFSNPPTVHRWNNYDGFREIAVFGNDDGTVHYFYIKTKTE